MPAKLAHPYHPLYISTLRSLALLNHNAGNYWYAIKLGEEVLDLSQKTIGKNHLEYAVTLINLALSYSEIDNHLRSVELAEGALAVLNNTVGKQHPLYTLALGNIGVIYSNKGDEEKSLDCSKQALSLIQENLPEDHPSLIYSLNDLAIAYLAVNDLEKAKLYGEMALNKINLYAGEEKHLYHSVFSNAGLIYLRDHDYKNAVKLISYSNKIKLDRIKINFSWLSEHERSIYWIKESGFYLKLPSLCYLSNSYVGFPELSYNSTLLSKGMLLQSSIELNKLLLESSNEELKEKINEIQNLRITLNKLYEKPEFERDIDAVTLEILAGELEREILLTSKEYGDYTLFMDVSWEDVQSKLGTNDIAIEFVEFPVYRSDSIMHAAMVLRKDWESPKMIPLFEKGEIETYMEQSPSKQYSGYVGKQLYKLMWQPLESVIEKGDNVYFSPAGVYHQLALEYLPTEDDIPLCDTYNMHRLSSTRQLVIEDRDIPHTKAVLYGGIEYDVSGDEMLAASKRYHQEEFYAYRGITVDSLRGGEWVTLANTVPEINYIAEVLEKKGVNTDIYTGTQANEESLKSLSGKKINVLHLATHGFFLPIEKAKDVQFYQMMGVENNPAPDLSMRRSGLIMAGGNGVWTGKSIPEGVEDGILTAQEISVLDFREMDMVVLSACETALGDVDTSEGVFGLQRAFKKAGVNTLLMSLWQVSDEVTKTLMNKFYQTLLEGKSKREAFLEAQRFVRSTHPDPKDWAAFVMID